MTLTRVTLVDADGGTIRAFYAPWLPWLSVEANALEILRDACPRGHVRQQGQFIAYDNSTPTELHCMIEVRRKRA